MKTKLTLRMSADLIAQAKAYARRSGKSVSEIVEQLFGLMNNRGRGEDRPPLPPTTKSLLGALRGHRASERDYYRHLEKKHR